MNAANMDIGAPQAGDNIRDWAAEQEAQLNVDYKWAADGTTDLLEEARDLPKEVTEESQIGTFGSVIKRMRDYFDKLESLRVTEKEPHLRRGNAVDGWFSVLKNKLARSKKTDNPGAIDILQARVDAFNQKKLAAEKAARDAEERARREEEDRLRREAEACERQAAEAAATAARARNADNIRKAEEEAAAARQEADRLRAEQDAARAARVDATAAAAAKPADMVRTRHEGGVLNTMRQVPYVEVVDRDKLDWKKLAPFFKDEHILQAVKGWAKTTSHKVQMDGAVIEMRSETVIR